MPWSRQINLAIDNDTINLPEILESPFTKSNYGALIFDYNTRRYTRSWRPYKHYFLLLNSINLPEWISKLFIDIEFNNQLIVGDLVLRVLSVTGRDIVTDLGKAQSIELLHEMEYELMSFGAIIKLPDIEELLQPELLCCGGLVTDYSPYPTYLVDHLPDILIRNVADTEIKIFVYENQDLGDERIISSIEIPINSKIQNIVLQLPRLDVGLYSIKGIKGRTQFKVVSKLFTSSPTTMAVKLELLQAESVVSSDDIRHFEYEGIVIKSWPNAKVYLTVATESGIYTYLLSLDRTGRELLMPTKHNYQLQQNGYIFGQVRGSL